MKNCDSKFEILEHTADLKLKAFGRDKKELFLNTMKGMFEAAGYEPEGRKIKRAIRISSSDTPSLLVDFLSEVLYLCETNKEIYHKIAFNKFSAQQLEAALIGRKLKRIKVQIKGVTFHDLDVRQRKDGSWQAVILFDI